MSQITRLATFTSMKHTLQDKIVLHLAEHGDWLPSYSLEKVNTKWGWVGSSGTRRCRELAEAGKHKIGSIEYIIENRKAGRYVEYRVVSQKDTRPIVTFEVRNGQRFAVLTKNI